LDTRTATPYFIEEPLPPGHVGFLVTRGQVRIQHVLWRPSQPNAIFDVDSATSAASAPPWRRFEGSNLDVVTDPQGGHNVFRLHAGSVESREVYTNYVLQMQYRQGHTSGRSSLFVRSLPGRQHTGYEISLQNFPRRQDRETDRGVDAGGFLGIKDARYIRVQDQEWNHLTAVVMGRQMKTWVNGVPVCYIEDRRTISTPTGPFLGPGTIRFSVPPENTDFQFRHLTVAPVL